MNHYQRLKVSQDAPAEVIRAAYRTLAAKLHPDRQMGGGSGGPEDATHGQMAALNAAYEVLIDPKLRSEYDATLLPPSPFAGATASASPRPATGGAPSADEPAGPSTRVDLNWVPPGVASTATPIWPPSQRMMLIGGSALAVLIIGTAGVLWQIMGQHQREKAMLNQYAVPPTAPAADQRAQQEMPGREASARPSSMPAPLMDQQAVAGSGTQARRPSVDELANMSDEELLKVLPTLEIDDPMPPEVAARLGTTARTRRGHPLDGSPMNLRTESKLVDPLAPEAAATAQRR